MERKQEVILDIPVDILTMADIQRDIGDYMSQGKKIMLTSVNPQIILMSRQNTAVREYLTTSTHRFADGIGVVKVSKWTRGKITERVAGIDVMAEALNYANAEKERIYLYGAKPEVLSKAISNIQKRYPQLVIAGSTDGYTNKTDQDLVADINKSGATMLFVALGSPKQEEWLEKNMTALNCLLYQTVGGSLDVLSGMVKRAPQLWITLNLEWVYRSMSNPKRMYRMFQAPEFIMKSLFWSWKYKRRSNISE